MRIMNVMLAKVRGGVEAMAVLYHQALQARGFDVMSVGHPQGMLTDALPRDEVLPLTAAFNLAPDAVLTLDRYLARFRPDIVLTHGNRAAGLALLPFMRSADKTVPVLHNAFFKPHLKHCRAAFCVSASVREAAEAALPGVPLGVVANFSNLERHEVKPPPGRVPVIGALGRLHEQKGFDILVRAAALLRDRGVPFRLKIGGDGEDRIGLERLIESLDLTALVELCGWIAPVAPFLRALDLFVVPSRYEPFGLVVIEAMAAGVPVIASALEGPREILADGRFGRLVADIGPETLADTLQAALGDWTTSLRMAERAQAQAMDTYSFAAGADRLHDAIMTVAGLAR